jgi:metal-responsive CopG/Arc/MetJ family transcriptional regulator
MKMIQITLDDNLFTEVDIASKEMHASRSAFVRKALREALHRMNISMLEQKHKAGYAVRPVLKKEFSVWESAQEWGDK